MYGRYGWLQPSVLNREFRSEVMLGAETVDTAEARKKLGHGLLYCIKLSCRSSKYAIGDRVQLIDDLKACKKLVAKGDGGWESDMDPLCGQPGVSRNVGTYITIDHFRRVLLITFKINYMLELYDH